MLDTSPFFLKSRTFLSGPALVERLLDHGFQALAGAGFQDVKANLEGFPALACSSSRFLLRVVAGVRLALQNPTTLVHWIDGDHIELQRQGDVRMKCFTPLAAKIPASLAWSVRPDSIARPMSHFRRRWHRQGW